MNMKSLDPLPPDAPHPRTLWRHYKGTTYRVLGVARNSEKPTEFLVVYEELTPSLYQQVPWCRPLSMWHELIPGTGLRRFELTGS
jgi:hypothetical protein